MAQVAAAGTRARVQAGPGLLGAVACGVLALCFLARSAALVHLAPGAVALPHQVGSAVVGLVAVLAGLAVGLRRPGSVVAALLGLQGLVPCVLATGDAWEAVVTASPQVLAPTPWGVALFEAGWMLWYLPSALLLLLFPTGSLPSRRWRPVVAGLLAVPVVFLAALATLPGKEDPPFAAVPAPWPAPPGPAAAVVTVLGTAAPLALLALLFLCLLAAVQRYRRSTGVAHAQLTWFLLGAIFVPFTLLMCWLSYLVLHGPDLALIGLFAVGVAIPLATGIAMLRHDLYDVDRALAAATTYGLLSVGLLAVYTLASFVGGLSLGRSSPVVAAAATAACATALAPLRSRLRRTIDRRVHPVRQRVLQAVTDLEARTHAGQASPEHLQAVLAEAFAAPGLRVGYRLPGGSGHVDADGRALPAASGGDRAVPVVVGGEEVGVLVAPAGAPRALLREAASASALLVEVVRLRVGLSGALRAVADSRSRLLAASVEERRRLEQDLHDGAQQRLVSLGMSLRLAQRHLTGGPGDGPGAGGVTAQELDGVLDGAVQQLSAAVSELRQIAHGLRPSSLDDGLGPALGSMLERVPAEVDLQVLGGSLEPLPEPAATTAYFVASEAVANAVRHAAAQRISLSVERTDGLLTVRIRDDGRGGARLVPGTGLAGLADRAAAAGGELRVSSPPGAGTVVEVVLPCAS